MDLQASTPLISVDELRDALMSPKETVLLDCRWYLDGRSGQQAYRDGHIPGAIFCAIDEVCSQPGPPSSGRHPLPSISHFVDGLARLGVGEDSEVVVYDDQMGSIAGRVWWMLDRLGINVRVLDGGIQGWIEVLEAGWNEPIPIATPMQRAGSWYDLGAVDTDQVAAMISDGSSIVLDARGLQRYLGETENIDRVAGHIPTAKSLPWTELTTEVGFKTSQEIRSIILGRLGTEPSTVVASCGSAITACTLLIGMRIAGLEDGYLYEGSYSGWSSDPQREICVSPC